MTIIHVFPKENLRERIRILEMANDLAPSRLIALFSSQSADLPLLDHATVAKCLVQKFNLWEPLAIAGSRAQPTGQEPHRACGLCRQVAAAPEKDTHHIKDIQRPGLPG